MAPRSRRSVLQATAVSLGVVGAGCIGSTETDKPEDMDGDPPNRDAERTDDQGGAEGEPADTEEGPQVPPGSPALDPSGGWPCFRFDAGNTAANSDGTGVRDGTLYWKLRAGGPVTLADGTLYNITSGEQGEAELTYRDPATAAVENRTQLGQDLVHHPPVVANGRVFVATAEKVVCFDATSGTQLWHSPPMNGAESGLTVADGLVLANAGRSGSLRAFETASGKEVWQYDLTTGRWENQWQETPAVGKNRAFICGENGLHAIDLASGENAYVQRDVTTHTGTCIVRDGTVYVVTSDGTLVAVDTTDGTVRWRASVSSRYTNDPDISGRPNQFPLVVANGTVYAYGESKLVALDIADGSSHRATIDAWPLRSAGDVLYTSDGFSVYALDLTTDLTPLWSLDTAYYGTDYVSSTIDFVTPVNGAVYVSAGGSLYGVGPRQQ